VVKPYVVYGQRGTGSVPIEATLLLLGEPFQVVERGPGEDRPAGNPMQQVPVLILPSGELMTESVAILIHLADSHPAARLAPTPDDPRRPAFLRWMVYVSAQIYALVWVRDDLAADEAHEPVILERTAERIAYCWRMMDAQVSPGATSWATTSRCSTSTSRWSPAGARAARASTRRRPSWPRSASSRRFRADS
jgi:GST-like protein